MEGYKNLKGETAIMTRSTRYLALNPHLNFADHTRLIQRNRRRHSNRFRKARANVIVNYTSPRGKVAAAAVSKSIEASGSKAAIVHANVAVTSDLQNS